MFVIGVINECVARAGDLFCSFFLLSCFPRHGRVQLIAAGAFLAEGAKAINTPEYYARVGP